MKILHLVDEPYDSGIVHYALTIAAGLQQQGHSIFFGGLDGRFPLKAAAHRGLKTINIPRSPAGIYSLRRFLAQNEVDLINAHTGSSHTLSVASTQFLSRAPRVVRTRADSRPVRRRLFSNYVWKRTSGFIAAARFIQDDFTSRFPTLSIERKIIFPGIEDNCKDLQGPPPTDPIRIGIVGRLDPVKGHIYFLKAAARVIKNFPRAVFVIVGREENMPARKLLSIASGLGIAKAVEFLGHVPDPMEIMRVCHIGVIASIASEAVCRAALEWMSAGRPVVASGVGCLPEVVSHATTGFLVPPRDPSALANKLSDILKNASLRLEMGREARRRFLSDFTIPRLVNETEIFYEATLHAVSHR